MSFEDRRGKRRGKKQKELENKIWEQFSHREEKRKKEKEREEKERDDIYKQKIYQSHSH